MSETVACGCTFSFIRVIPESECKQDTEGTMGEAGLALADRNAKSKLLPPSLLRLMLLVKAKVATREEEGPFAFDGFVLG